MEEYYVQWIANEHIHKKRGADWFWTVGALSAAATAAAFILDNTLLGILILISAIAIFLQAMKKPKEVQFTVSDSGIYIDKALYPYEHLESFGTTEESILIKSKKRFMPFLVIPLPPEEYDEDVYAILSEHLPEEDHEEPVAEKIFEQLGF